ncbi:2-oxoglutarate dehydrogenase complex dihydrolipoyllysine-residue succinyltransferase [Gammaproteobacteria bacterium]|nr:2-oxoglutarate dehydrogenase complex dihydrolipoyllysine-residue succinyltransferase [Gammaproteobacteria bacterium]
MLVDIKVPVLAESVAEATLISWQKRVGEQVKRGDNLIDIETDKVTLEVAALNDGVISEILRDDGETVGSDEVIARIDTEAESNISKSAPPIAEPTQQSLPEMDTKTMEVFETDLPKLSPAVRNMVKEQKLDIAEIATNTDRITKTDVLRHIEGSKMTPKSESISTPPVTVPVLMNSISDRPEEKVPMTRLRKRVAERLLSAQHESAILTTFNEVNMQPIMDIRNRYKDEFEKTHGTKLGFMSFFTRAAIEALKKFPVINASVDGDSIVYHGYFDIGIAVSSPKGLVVPIVRDADSLSLANIESQIRSFGEKARNGKLTMDNLTGGTFTITNGGTFGSLLSTPIINPPQSAILGMHAIKDRPVADNGEVVIRPMMNLALSYDHRIIDGREAVQFLVSIKQQLEDPSRLLLQL